MDVVRPSAICIGAQKAGTTALHHYLELHPGVVRTGGKEFEFFSSDIRYSQGVSFYHSFFPERTAENAGKISFDITPGYMGGAERAAPRIHEYDPGMRLIALLRNPVTRAYSAWQMYRGFCAANRNWFWEWLEAKGGTGDPKELYTARSADFGNSFYEDMREEIESFDSGRDMEMPILRLGAYARLLKHYLDCFERDQMLVIPTASFYEDTRREMGRIEGFVGLEAHSWGEEALRPQFVGEYTEKITPRENDLLQSFYREHNLELCELVQQEFRWDKNCPRSL